MHYNLFMKEKEVNTLLEEFFERGGNVTKLPKMKAYGYQGPSFKFSRSSDYEKQSYRKGKRVTGKNKKVYR